MSETRVSSIFEPFGLEVRLPKGADPAAHDGLVGGAQPSSRLYRATLYGFWLLVCAIVVARIVMASHGSLFAFAV